MFIRCGNWRCVPVCSLREGERRGRERGGDEGGEGRGGGRGRGRQRRERGRGRGRKVASVRIDPSPFLSPSSSLLSLSLFSSFRSHGPIAARSLGTYAMVTAWSGDGLVRNYNDPNQLSSSPLPSYLPSIHTTYFNLIYFNFFPVFSWFFLDKMRFYDLAVGGSSSYGTWDFSKWVHQAVVINLGTLLLSSLSLPSPSRPYPPASSPSLLLPPLPLL